MSILKKLYSGEIIPCETNNTDSELISRLCQKETKLIETLNICQKEAFEEYRDAFNEIEYAIRCDNFAEGFKLGAQILMELQQ